MNRSGEWDYIVVGGGAAGCVLAARLTESRDTSALLLEAGGEYPRAALAVPLAGMRRMKSSASGSIWKPGIAGGAGPTRRS